MSSLPFNAFFGLLIFKHFVLLNCIKQKSSKVFNKFSKVFNSMVQNNVSDHLLFISLTLIVGPGVVNRV